jgi:hypothetical protein
MPDNYVGVAQIQWLKDMSKPCLHVAVNVLCPWKESHGYTRVYPSWQMIPPPHMPEALSIIRHKDELLDM